MNLFKHRTYFSTIIFIVMGAIIGFLTVVLPPYLLPNGIVTRYDSPLFPFIKTAIENLSILHTSILLFIVGSVFGYLKPKIWWLLGISLILLFPVATLIEVLYAPQSHNLWPFEMIIYGMIDLPAFIGAFVGFLLTRLKTKRLFKSSHLNIE